MTVDPVTSIGPECFASADQSVICWQGVNYYREPDDDQLARVFDAVQEWELEADSHESASDVVRRVVGASPTCFDLSHEHLTSSCEVQDKRYEGYNDRLRAYIEAAILDQAPTWESLFDRGPGQVVGVPDAAIVAAMAASRFRILDGIDSEGCERCARARERHPDWAPEQVNSVHFINNHDGTNPERRFPE